MRRVLRQLFVCSVALAILFIIPSIVMADGIIIIDPVPVMEQPPTPLEIKYHRVDITIKNQVGITHIDEVFVNPNDYEVEGTFIFPLPEGASISDFSMYIDGKEVKGEVLPADEARKIYEDIVRSMKDPALLEYMGRNLFKLRIYPIPAHGERRVELTYNETLKYDFGSIKYVYPLSTEKYSSTPLEEVTISADIESSAPINNVYSPTHDIDIVRKGEGRVVLSFEDKDVLPDKDFILYYNTTTEDVDVSLITYRERKRETGYFMLLISPKPEIDPEDIVAKDVTFVLDTSGSMGGEKLVQAQDALKFCVESLEKGDRFNIIRFATDTESFKNSLVYANEKNISTALDFIDGLKARGGTNINDALLKALDTKGDRERPHIVVFLTDGEPTVGETDIADIIDNVSDANGDDARIFVFGVGVDINTHLLDKISGGNNGVSDYVTPSEDIEEVVSNFFIKVKSPVMSDVTFEIDDIKIVDFYPQKLPDLFAGSQITLIGKYRGSGETTLVLRGYLGGKELVFEYNVQFPEKDTTNDFLPRIWATRKIAYLLDEIRLNGESKELVDEVMELAQTFGIITPYTSYLVTEYEEQGYEGFAHDASEEDVRMMTSAPMLKESTGGFAVESAEKMKDKKGIDRAVGPELLTIKQVGERTFFFEDDAWIDSEYVEGTKTIKIDFNSDKYWDFTVENLEVGKILSLGKKVLFEFEGQWYQTF